MNQTRTGAAAAAFLCVLAAVASPRSALFEAPIASLGGVKVLSTTPYVARKDDFLAGRGAGEFTRVNFVRFAEAAFERIPSPRRVSIH